MRSTAVFFGLMLWMGTALGADMVGGKVVAIDDGKVTLLVDGARKSFTFKNTKFEDPDGKPMPDGSKDKRWVGAEAIATVEGKNATTIRLTVLKENVAKKEPPKVEPKPVVKKESPVKDDPKSTIKKEPAKPKYDPPTLKNELGLRDDWPTVVGELAKVVKVDVALGTAQVQMSDGQTRDITGLNGDIVFVGPRDALAESMADDRFTPGRTIKIVSLQGVVKEIHLQIVKPTDQ